MEGEARREKIIELLWHATAPISGTELAKSFAVSRQVVVQDIALLRAVNKNILSTNKGYILYDPDKGASKAKRTFRVHHGDDQIEEELNLIVDNGGKVLDVVVEHDIYGQITVDLLLKNRLDVSEFVDKVRHSKSHPLKILTGDFHYHTVEAESEQILDRIQKALQDAGMLAAG